jgi:hypothetical protein
MKATRTMVVDKTLIYSTNKKTLICTQLKTASKSTTNVLRLFVRLFRVKVGFTVRVKFRIKLRVGVG